MYGSAPYRKQLSSGTVGAMSELLAATSLMSQGYEVFRALSPSSSCDLLALKKGQMFTFEIRTGYRTKTGNLIYSKHNLRAKHIFVVVLGPDGNAIETYCMPELKERQVV